MRNAGTWSVKLPVHQHLPLYAFAMCRYRLPEKVTLEHGETSTFVLNSKEHMLVPPTVNLKALSDIPAKQTLVDDFANGMQNWSTRDGRTIKTYGFQSPDLDRSNDRKLSLTIDPHGKRLALRLNIGSKFLHQPDNLGDFTFATRINGQGPQEVVIAREDFRSDDGKTLEWSKIATFEITIIDEATRQKLPLSSPEGQAILHRITLID